MPPIVGVSADWPRYICDTVRDVPCCWSLDDHLATSSSTKENNLYTALIYSQEGAIYLGRVVEQKDQDLETSYSALDEQKRKLCEATAALAHTEVDLKAAQERSTELAVQVADATPRGEPRSMTIARSKSL